MNATDVPKPPIAARCPECGRMLKMGAGQPECISCGWAEKSFEFISDTSKSSGGRDEYLADLTPALTPSLDRPKKVSAAVRALRVEFREKPSVKSPEVRTTGLDSLDTVLDTDLTAENNQLDEDEAKPVVTVQDADRVIDARLGDLIKEECLGYISGQSLDVDTELPIPDLFKHTLMALLFNMQEAQIEANRAEDKLKALQAESVHNPQTHCETLELRGELKALYGVIDRLLMRAPV